METTRRYPRSLSEAYPQDRAGCITTPDDRVIGLPPRVIRTKTGPVDSLLEFIAVYRQYRAAHGRRYSARMAWDIAVRGLPF
jgi:hypothetical protein